MDAVPKENSDILGQKEILVPPETAHAFARGLRQSLSQQLQAIDASLNKLTGKPHHQIMKDAFGRISSLLDNLEKAKEVKFLPSEPGFDFKFSEETEKEEPKPKEVLMDSSITPKFVSALSHTLINPLGIVQGRAEGIQSQEADKIVNASKKIGETIKSFNNAQEIKMTTDAEGNTTITPIRDSN